MLLQSIYASIWCFHQPGSMIMSHYVQCTWNWPIWDNSRTNIHQVNCSSSLIYITHSWVLPLNFIHNVPPQYYMSQMQELTLSGAYSFHFLAGSISRRKTIYVLMQVRSSSHWNYSLFVEHFTEFWIQKQTMHWHNVMKSFHKSRERRWVFLSKWEQTSAAKRAIRMVQERLEKYLKKP